jgi:DNA-binding CsgD family transcriptional regulator
MEGGFLMNNTAHITGGALHLGSRASFTKTGGIIYGANAPAGYRNTALLGRGTPAIYGHAVYVAIEDPSCQFRNDTVGKNDKLSYAGVAQGNGIFGERDKWDNPDKAFRRILLAVILSVLALAVCGFLIYRKRYLMKMAKTIQEAADSAVYTAPKIDLENKGLTSREKDICELLLTDRTLKDIATILGLGYSGAHANAQKLYAKLGIRDRTELLVRVRREKN